MSELPRAYLDTCVISGLAKQDLKRAEQDAANQLVNWVRDNSLTVCPSTEARGEIDKVPEEHREQHVEQYEKIAVLKKAADWYDSDEVYTFEAQDVLGDLESFLPDEKDARHIAHAAMHDVKDFVTTDQRTILRFREQIRRASAVDVFSPSEYLTKIESERGY